MWTICWASRDFSGGWDRFETREDIINFANTLVREGDICEEDILIFSPEADSYTVAYNDLEKGDENL